MAAPRAFGGFSLTLTMTTSIGLLVIAGVMAMYVYYGELLQRAAGGASADRADLMTQTLQAPIDTAVAQAEQMAVQLGAMAADGDTDGWAGRAADMLAAAPVVPAAWLALPDGDVIWAVPPSSSLDVARVDRPTGLSEGDSWFGPVEPTPGRPPLLQHVRLVDTDAGGVQVGVVLSLAALGDQLQPIADRHEATVFLLDETERVVAVAAGYQPFQPLSPGDDPDHRPPLPPETPPDLNHLPASLAESGDPRLAMMSRVGNDGGMAEDLGRIGGLRALNTRQMLDGTPVSDVPSLMYLLRDVSIGGDLDWTVGLYIAPPHISADLKTASDASMIGLVILAVSLVAAAGLARVISGPVRGVAGTARKIADLDLDRVERLPPSRIRELNEQAQAMNAMLDGLRWFEIYAPKSLVRRLMTRGAEGVPSESVDITVMFTDLAGFTAQSEAMDAADVAALLNRHFEILGAAVEAEGGTIDKFMGDALMAFWGAPDPQSDHPVRAAAAALTIRRAVVSENDRRAAEGQTRIRMRIGLHTGRVVAGNIGAPQRMGYTVIGDAVNVGQRLEALGKVEAGDEEVAILVSGDLVAAAEAAGGTLPAYRVIGPRQVKGRDEPVDVIAL